MFLVGVLRPAFNFAVNHTFGLEANGHAAELIALVMLATLPATSSIPPTMVRHMSRAFAAGNKPEAIAHARLATFASMLLAFGAIPVVAIARSELSAVEIVIVGAGIVTMAYWRLFRGLFLAIGRTAYSLKADLLAALAMPVTLVFFYLYDLPGWSAAIFFSVYVAYTLFTLPAGARAISAEHLPLAQVRSEFFRYNVLNMIGTATSLAARDLALLVAKEREGAALVGELAFAMSLVSLLAFASRVLDLPMVTELGQRDAEKQRALTERASHFMWIAVFGAGLGVAILAPVILPLGEANSPVIAIAFVITAFAFMLEIIQSPATALIFSEAHPGVLASISVVSLLAALTWWYVPAFTAIDGGVLGAVIGLAISHAIKAIGIGVYARVRFRVRNFLRPVAKTITTLVGLGAVVASLSGTVSPVIAFAGFAAVMLFAFYGEMLELLRALRR